MNISYLISYQQVIVESRVSYQGSLIINPVVFLALSLHNLLWVDFVTSSLIIWKAKVHCYAYLPNVVTFYYGMWKIIFVDITTHFTRK